MFHFKYVCPQNFWDKYFVLYWFAAIIAYRKPKHNSISKAVKPFPRLVRVIKGLTHLSQAKMYLNTIFF